MTHLLIVMTHQYGVCAEAALRSIWVALGRPPLVGWGSSSDSNPCSAWQGVTCANGLVTSLYGPPRLHLETLNPCGALI